MVEVEEPDLAELVARVRRELVSLRGKNGRLTLQKFAAYRTLVAVCGEGDDEDAFTAFERELERYKSGNKFEAAAACSICADAEQVIYRLLATAETLATDEDDVRDQRTARAWSDRGMPQIAHDLAYFAMVRGRLGRDVISIELSAADTNNVELLMEQIVSTDLANRAPVVTVWQLPDAEDGGTRTVIDLDRVQEGVTTKNGLLMKSYRIKVALPERPSPGEESRLLSVIIEARRAPTPTFFYQQAPRDHGPEIRVSIYRSIFVIDAVRNRHAGARDCLQA